MDIIKIAKPFMLKLSKELNESCSLGEIQDRDIVYIVQEQVARVMTVSFKVGSRIPAHVTSMGRMILAMNPDLQDKLLDQFEYSPFTDRTITTKEELKKELKTIKKQGWALVDQELEEGLRAISTPVFSKNNEVRYAMTIISTTNRINKEEMLHRFLPAMQHTCREISRALGMI
jgi:IclR family pca regulon transcriptional regulator